MLGLRAFHRTSIEKAGRKVLHRDVLDTLEAAHSSSEHTRSPCPPSSPSLPPQNSHPPSYLPSDTSVRTRLGNLIYVGALVGSGYSAFALIKYYVVDFNESEGDSMIPTIPKAHSISITSPRYRNGKNIKIGDIVQIKHPMMPRTIAGKRVIGLPGDYVLRDEHMSPTAGGASVPGIFEGERKEPMMLQVPEGHVWLAGDNMGRSRDSRFYGPVPLALITCKVLYNGDGVLDWTSFRYEQLKSPVHCLRINCGCGR